MNTAPTESLMSFRNSQGCLVYVLPSTPHAIRRGLRMIFQLQSAETTAFTGILGTEPVLLFPLALFLEGTCNLACVCACAQQFQISMSTSALWDSKRQVPTLKPHDCNFSQRRFLFPPRILICVMHWCDKSLPAGPNSEWRPKPSDSIPIPHLALACDLPETFWFQQILPSFGFFWVCQLGVHDLSQ